MYRVALIVGAQVGYGPVHATEIEARDELRDSARSARRGSMRRLAFRFSLEWQDDDGTWIEIDAIQT